MDQPAAPDEILVRFLPDLTTADVIDRTAQLGARVIRRLDPVEGLYLIGLPAGMTVADARAAFARLSNVLYAEPNYLLQSFVTPNDPSFTSLWGLHNTGQDGGSTDADIDAPEAWNLTKGSSSVVVAVIDTGVDYTHPDLVANMFRNEADCNSDGVDNDGNGYVDDCYGIDTANDDSNPMDDNRHGTHVSGTIGAVGDNGVGVVGVNWNVKIMACKFLNASGSGSTADAIDCLNYVKIMKDRGVNIVATSNSWGGGGFSQGLYDAIDAQRQRGILFIAAAGNAASDNDLTANYPSNYDLPNIIAVASTTRTDAVSSFSNYGRRTVHVGAPGSDIYSTTLNNTYTSLSGTSMATPHVTGVAALLKAQDANRDWRAIKNLILAGGDINSNLSNTITGRRLNAYGSLTCSNVEVQSRLRPVTSSISAASGEPVTLSALHINCANPAGSVAVVITPGNQTVTLVDNGVTPDQVAGDGIYSGSFVPTSGIYTATFPGGDAVTIELGNASYDSSLKVPMCESSGSYCSSGQALNGRDTLAGGAEVHQPNTLNDSCADGTAGTFHSDESIDRLKVSRVNGTTLAAGKTAKIEATVYVWGVADDRLDLYYASNADVPSWTFLTTITPSSTGLQTLSATYTLPPGVKQAIRANFRFLGTAATCTTGGYDDHDDLVFTVVGAFTDDTLSTGLAGTTIKAAHFIELRDRINVVRAAWNLNPVSWADGPLIPYSSVYVSHIQQLRDALNAAYDAASRARPVYQDDPLVPGTIIKAIHITQLRDAVKALE